MYEVTLDDTKADHETFSSRVPAPTSEMSNYLAKMMEQRRNHPQDDLLTRPMESEVEGERLSHEEILAFSQLLVVAGQEATSDPVNNAILSLLENPQQPVSLRPSIALIGNRRGFALPFANTMDDADAAPHVELHGVRIPSGAFLLPMIGSANRGPRQFENPNHFNIARDPTRTSRSGTGFTTAWARRFRAWKPESRSRIYFSGSSTSNSRPISHGSRATSYMCTDPLICPSASNWIDKGRFRRRASSLPRSKTLKATQPHGRHQT